jgi:SAM-dependent methyltransferase
MRVLEIGCGIGRMLQFFGLLFAEAHGIDVAPSMVAQARAYLRRAANVTVHLGDGCSLAGLADAHFSVVVSFQVFQHIPDRDVIAAYVREAFRVLRPRGFAKVLVKTKPWQGQGESPDTWCGADIASVDVDRWLAADPWQLRSFAETPVDATKAWVLLQKP